MAMLTCLNHAETFTNDTWCQGCLDEAEAARQERLAYEHLQARDEIEYQEQEGE